MKSTRTRAKNDVIGSRRSEPIIFSDFLPQFYQGRVCKYAAWCKVCHTSYPGNVNIGYFSGWLDLLCEMSVNARTSKVLGSAEEKPQYDNIHMAQLAGIRPNIVHKYEPR
ncbi:hypothetical protein AVEN_43044-1 [Araneus ventricosus]|uniref:Uncharacterized protein n=1 Tax=Araneus ventricosus TaxID=182803 RepID=A0A4Y2H5A9_ARAVE|nr:hypothetical protein AVEN_43044-1 [Araneus ventricosus]